MRVNAIWVMILACMVLASSASAVPTTIVVRVKSKDAKFIGTSMGGALVVIKDAETGELLAKGITAGGTGDTGQIMGTSTTGRTPLSDEQTAKFETTLDIEEPRLVEVSAYGPLGQRQAANKVSATQWIVPGAHLIGRDGWMLEMPGIVVDVQAPPAHLILQGLPRRVVIQANVTMMCGCPVLPGGLWDSDKMDVKALLKRDGKSIGALDLDFSGEASQFSGTWEVTEKGVYEATVYAYDPANGNTGLDKVTFVAY
jgi:hypothetical protein